jgi:phage baseplate assembly protein W
MTQNQHRGSEAADAFLGTGWRYPVETDERRRVALSSEEYDIREAIRIILGTTPGERVMRPEFGCGIHELAFEIVNATTLANAESSVREALDRWEYRIDLLSVSASTEEIDQGRLLVHIDYRIRSTNAEANLVYPFYLREGRNDG